MTSAEFQAERGIACKPEARGKIGAFLELQVDALPAKIATAGESCGRSGGHWLRVGIARLQIFRIPIDRYGNRRLMSLTNVSM
jgi:hypothetical protein